MKRKTSSTGLLDKTIWNPRPVIGLLTRAIRESGGSFLLVLGPTFSALLTNKALLTNAVGTDTAGSGLGPTSGKKAKTDFLEAKIDNS